MLSQPILGELVRSFPSHKALGVKGTQVWVVLGRVIGQIIVKGNLVVGSWLSKFTHLFIAFIITIYFDLRSR